MRNGLRIAQKFPLLPIVVAVGSTLQLLPRGKFQMKAGVSNVNSTGTETGWWEGKGAGVSVAEQTRPMDLIGLKMHTPSRLYLYTGPCNVPRGWARLLAERGQHRCPAS